MNLETIELRFFNAVTQKEKIGQTHTAQSDLDTIWLIQEVKNLRRRVSELEHDVLMFTGRFISPSIEK